MTTDENLWLMIKEDDEKSFAILFSRYSSIIFNNVYAYLKDKETCEQIVHDVFLSLWKNRKTLMIRSFRAYTVSASRYIVYKHIAANKKLNLSYEEDLSVYSAASVENSGYYNLAYTNLEEELYRHLDKLPKRCREIFLMSRKSLLNNDEIALKLGISKRAVENQITYALKHLRGSLKDSAVLLILMGLQVISP
uniref:RNA polymerase sigma factor n=1 Tax=Pedobacter schmidteae TaxID=2201271 RepID=UPI000EAC1AFD|nr:sigma-70 family RNA polymerase sigma factor [Pedobacter schmidteae]